MKEIFDKKNYKDKYVMECKNKREAELFCDYLMDIGIDRYSNIGVSLSEILWLGENEERNVYVDFNEFAITVGDRSHNGYKKLVFSDFDWQYVELINILDLAQLETKPNTIMVNDCKYNYNKDEDCYYEGDSGYEKLTMHIPFKDYTKKQIRIVKELLNNEEKSFIKMLKRFSNNIVYIEKISTVTTIGICLVYYNEDKNRVGDNDIEKSYFKNLEANKKYSISELLGDD